MQTLIIALLVMQAILVMAWAYMETDGLRWRLDDQITEWQRRRSKRAGALSPEAQLYVDMLNKGAKG